MNHPIKVFILSLILLSSFRAAAQEGLSPWEPHPTIVGNIHNESVKIVSVETTSTVLALSPSPPTIQTPQSGACGNRAGMYIYFDNPAAKYFYATALAAKLSGLTVYVQLACEQEKGRWLVVDLGLNESLQP